MNLKTVHNSQPLNEPALLAGSQIKPLSTVISRICHDEPNLEYIVPDQAARRMVLPSFLQAAILAGQLYGQVHIGENHEGIAVWIGPEHNLRFRQTMQTTLPEECLERYMKLAESVEVARTHLAVRPHWYLILLAADASLPDKIIGETLIAPVLSQADSTGTPCYLETFDASRLSLYRDHGFEITGAGRIPDGGPNFWTMARTAFLPPFLPSLLLTCLQRRRTRPRRRSRTEGLNPCHPRLRISSYEVFAQRLHEDLMDEVTTLREDALEWLLHRQSEGMQCYYISKAR